MDSTKFSEMEDAEDYINRYGRTGRHALNNTASQFAAHPTTVGKFTSGNSIWIHSRHDE